MEKGNSALPTCPIPAPTGQSLLDNCWSTCKPGKAAGGSPSTWAPGPWWETWMKLPALVWLSQQSTSANRFTQQEQSEGQ